MSLLFFLFGCSSSVVVMETCGWKLELGSWWSGNGEEKLTFTQYSFYARNWARCVCIKILPLILFNPHKNSVKLVLASILQIKKLRLRDKKTVSVGNKCLGQKDGG